MSSLSDRRLHVYVLADDPEKPPAFEATLRDAHPGDCYVLRCVDRATGHLVLERFLATDEKR